MRWTAPSEPASSLWLELAIDEPRWRGHVFLLSYSPRSGEMVEFTVRRSADAARLSAQALQRIPLGALDRAARRHVREFLTEWDRCGPADVRALFPDPADWIDAVADAKTDPARDLQTAQLCRRYLELEGATGWRETLASEFHWDPSSIPTLISRARARRFLTPVPPRQHGGQLTPKALRLLAPPKYRSAWDQATEEQRRAAFDRESMRRQLEAELWKQHEAGEVDDVAFGARSLAIDALVVGWEPRELYPDEPTLALVEREFQRLKEEGRT